MSFLSSLFGSNKSSKTTAVKSPSRKYQFSEPENTACFTCKHVVKGGAEILYVTHDADEGGWQFLCGGDHTEDDAMIVGMGEITKIDPSVNGLYEMPEGVGALRE